MHLRRANPVYPRLQARAASRGRGGGGFRDGSKAERGLSAARHGESDMASAIQKITLAPRATSPLTSSSLARRNVRRVKAGVSIEELAEDIARRTLLQGLSVRPILDAEGRETDMFEVPAGGRRYRVLELLVKQKRLAKTALLPSHTRRSEESQALQQFSTPIALGFAAATVAAITPADRARTFGRHRPSRHLCRVCRAALVLNEFADG